MKIKIFTSPSVQDLEKAMNKFIKENDAVIEDLKPIYSPSAYVVVLQYRKRIKV